MNDQLHLTDDDLVLHYYGEELPRAESHLEGCAACQANLARLQRVMAFIDSAPPVEAPVGFERIAWARVEPAIAAPRRGWLSWFVFSPARLAFAAGVLVLVRSSFMAGRMMTRPGAGAGAAGARTEAQ